MTLKFILLFLLFNSFLHAQTIKYVNTKTITVQDGLTSTNIRKIIKDNNGFLWLSTQDGLNKYDGTNIEKFSSISNNPKTNLLGTDCYSMVFDTTQTLLYVLTGFEGLNIIDVKTNIVIQKIDYKKIIDQKESVWLKKLIITKEHLIICLADKLIFLNKKTLRRENSQLLPFAKNEELDHLYYENNKIHIITSLNIYYVFDINNYSLTNKFILFEKTKGFAINNFTKNENGYFISTNQGLYYFDEKTKKTSSIIELYPNLPEKIAKEPSYAVLKNKNSLYFSTSTGLFEYDILLQRFYNYCDNKNEEKNSFFKNANTIFISDGNLFIGGAYGLIAITQELPFFKTVFRNNLFKLDQVYNIKSINDSIIIVGAKNGAFKVNFKTKLIESVYSGNTIYSCCVLDKNTYLLGSNNQIYYCNNENVIPIENKFKSFSKISKEFLVCMEKVSDETVLMASQNGLGLINWNIKSNEVKIINKTTLPSINNTLINNFFKYNDKICYIITETEIVEYNYIQNTTKIVFKKDNVADAAGILMDMCFLKGNFYIALYGVGIVQLDQNFNVKKIFNAKDGLSNFALYKIISDNDSLINVTSNIGLNVLNINTEKISTLYDIDGLQNNEFNEGSGFKNNKTIYFGGIEGVTEFNTRFYINNFSIPKVYFGKILIRTKNGNFDSTNTAIDKISIPNNTTQVRINFVGIDYVNTSKLKYKYRISDLQNNWTENGNQNFIDLIGTGPGKYKLEIIAYYDDDNQSKPIYLTLIFLPKWYQTWWFKTLIVLSIIGIAYLLYKMRITQIIKEQKIKNALASDLHDELGSSLTGLKVYAYQAKKNPEYMESLEEGISQSIKSVREMIWQLNEEKLTVYDLINKLAIIYKPLLKINNITLNINVATEISSIELNQKEKSHLYLIIKEIINNAMKYAQASELNIDVAKGKSRLRFSIADNGIGIQGDSKGYGLKNIEARAKEIKYTVSTNTGNTGTEFILEK